MHSKEKDEACLSFLEEIFTKSVHRGGVWYPEDFSQAPFKKGAHRALDDIRESIEELKYYKKICI